MLLSTLCVRQSFDKFSKLRQIGITKKLGAVCSLSLTLITFGSYQNTDF